MPDSGLLVLARTRREQQVKNFQPGDLVTVCNHPQWARRKGVNDGDLGLIVSKPDNSLKIFIVLFPSGPIQVSSYWLEPAGSGT
jgi:hypothetical protein